MTVRYQLLCSIIYHTIITRSATKEWQFICDGFPNEFELYASCDMFFMPNMYIMKFKTCLATQKCNYKHIKPDLVT